MDQVTVAYIIVLLMIELSTFRKGHKLSGSLLFDKLKIAYLKLLFKLITCSCYVLYM